MCLAAAVYAEQLLPKGHGYPLWIPEPDTVDREVRIGDVGYVWEGSFCTLFNATLPKTHPINRKGVPEGFIPLDFNTAELVRTRDGYLPDAPVCSQTVRRLSAVAQAGATSPLVPVGAQTHLSFECARSKGGLVVLNGGGAIQEVLRPNKAFPEYMHTYHDSWCDFAREKGHDVSPEDIVMVRGTVKASEWTVAAFMDETRHQSLELEAQGGLIGSAGISLSLSVASSMSVEHRSGRSQPRISSDEEDSAANFRPMRNQCMFLCRYKMRYRKWPWQIKKIKAEGYRDDEPSSDSDSEEDTSTESDSEDESLIEDDCALMKVLDPVDTLMDYILENSGCDAAIVSDEDVWDLQNLGYVTTASQFAEQLRTSRPSVCVSANGVGCVNLQAVVHQNTAGLDGEEVLELVEEPNTQELDPFPLFEEYPALPLSWDDTLSLIDDIPGTSSLPQARPSTYNPLDHPLDAPLIDFDSVEGDSIFNNPFPTRPMYYTPTSVPMVPSLASLPPTLSLPSIQPYPSLSSILQTPYAPPSPILASSTPAIPQHSNTRDIHDPQVILHPGAQNDLPTIRRGTEDDDDDSLSLKPGNIFVWEEHTKSDSEGGGGIRSIPRSSGHLYVPGSLSLQSTSHNSDKFYLSPPIEFFHTATPSLSSQDNRTQPPRPWHHLPETAPVYTWQMSRSGGGKSASPMKRIWSQREDGGIPTTANVLLSEVCPLSKLDPAFVSMLETNYEANMVRNLSLRLDCVVWQSVSPPTRKKVTQPRTFMGSMRLESVGLPPRDELLRTLTDGVVDFLRYTEDNPPKEFGDHTLELGTRDIQMECLHLAGLRRVADEHWQVEIYYCPRQVGRHRDRWTLLLWCCCGIFFCIALCAIVFLVC